MSSQRLVGLDVAKAPRAMALRPTGDRWAVPNDETGLAALGARLQALPPTLIGLEATGGDPRAVVAARAAAALPIVVGNPRPVRDLAKATGPLAKTAPREARAVAHLAEAGRPGLRPLPDAETEERRALLARRRHRIARRPADQTRLEKAPRRLRAAIEAPIAWLHPRVAAVADDLDTTLRASPVGRERET
jgi:transposase